MNSPDIHTLLSTLWNDLHDPRVLRELVVLGVALALAAWVNRLLRPRFSGSEDAPNFGLGGLQRMQMPLTALLVVLIGRAALKAWDSSVGLLNLAVPLLTVSLVLTARGSIRGQNGRIRDRRRWRPRGSAGARRATARGARRSGGRKRNRRGGN